MAQEIIQKTRWGWMRSVSIFFFLYSVFAWSATSVSKPRKEIELDFKNKPQYLHKEHAYLLHSDTGQRDALTLEVARRRLELEKGLMFRTHLDDMSGMIFLFDKASQHMMWMQNTYIGLDMLFLDCAGRIIDKIENAQPQSETILRSDKPSCAVLELNTGSVMRLKIHVGDVIVHPAFPIQPKESSSLMNE